MKNHITENTQENANGTAVTNPQGGGALGVLVWPVLQAARGRVLLALLAMVISSGMMLSLGWGLKCVIDRGFGDPSGRMLNQALAVMLGMIVLMAGASFARLYLMSDIAEKLSLNLRTRIFSHLLSLDPGYYDRHKFGDLISRIGTDTSLLQTVLTGQLPVMMRHGIMLIGGFVMLGVTSLEMTKVLLVAIPAVLLPLVLFIRLVKRRARETQDSLGLISAAGLERLQGLQVIQSFGYEDNACREFSDVARHSMERAMRHARTRAFMTATVIAVLFSAMGLVLWFGGHKVITGQMTGGALSAFIFYAAMVAGSVVNLSDAGGEYTRALAAAGRLAAILFEKPALGTEGLGAQWPTENTSCTVSFEGVSFSYPARPDARVLENVTFEAPAGSMTAIVGASGAGKSTLFQLLQRFYAPETGRIRIDGYDIAAYAPQATRALMGVVAQDPVIFSMSVADNIRIAKPDASDAEVRRAAEMAQADGFINELPNGYATEVGERGSQLSGGQRQRIAIARAFLKNPRILILDEATSALDAENEQAIYFALKTLMRGRTTLVIAHRAATIKGADRVIVIDKGRVAAIGTPESLLAAQNEIFKGLVSQTAQNTGKTAA